ncbi:lipopolysaccharide biosynthesis protein [Microbacterium sp. CR_7]|uniref:lipopolysaccharide biosynthesis protein n=1 Tax=Microbacterium sp. CR_7 TaxID=3055792 RepID=UPI0035C1453A
MRRPRGLVALRRLSGFTVSVAITAVISVAAIPTLITALGAGAWAQIGVAQTFVQFAAIFVGFGWGATGPALVASTALARRHSLFLESLRSRLILAAVAAPLSFAILAVMLRGDALIAGLGTVAYLLPALGGTWYYAGAAKPARLLLMNTLPTALGTISGIVAAHITHQAWSFLALQAVGSGVAAACDSAYIWRHTRETADGTEPRPTRTVLSSQRHAVVTSATSSLYVTLPVLAINAFLGDGPALASYLIADRMFRFASIAFLPVQQFFQGWVPEIPAEFSRRTRIATIAAVAIGTLGGACIAFLSPVFGPILGANEVGVPLAVSIPLGVAFIGIGTTAVVGYACLVAVGRTKALAGSTVVGAAVGAPLILFGAGTGSLLLVASAVAVSEICVAIYQLFALRTALRAGNGLPAPVSDPDEDRDHSASRQEEPDA